jgi:hypothetical protein
MVTATSRTSRILAACAAVFLGCRGLRSYEKATAQFGDATSAGVTATRNVVGAAHEICQMRAWFHAVGDRFQRPGFKRGREVLSRSSDVPKPDGRGTMTWGEYCRQLADDDQAFGGALSALEAYAAALRNVATGNDIALDADLTAAVARDAGDVAKKLGSSSLRRAQELSGPLTALASVVLDIIKTKRLRDAIIQGDKPVSTILHGMGQYLGAAKDQRRDAEELKNDLVRSADQAIPVRGESKAVPPDIAGSSLALYEFSRLESARLLALDQQLTATADLVRNLSEAHAELVRGAHASVTDQAVRAFIATKAEAIAKQVNVLRNIKG